MRPVLLIFELVACSAGNRAGCSRLLAGRVRSHHELARGGAAAFGGPACGPPAGRLTVVPHAIFGRAAPPAGHRRPAATASDWPYTMAAPKRSTTFPARRVLAAAGPGSRSRHRRRVRPPRSHRIYRTPALRAAKLGHRQERATGDAGLRRVLKVLRRRAVLHMALRRCSISAALTGGALTSSNARWAPGDRTTDIRSPPGYGAHRGDFPLSAMPRIGKAGVHTGADDRRTSGPFFLVLALIRYAASGRS